jgi:uncharacterized protein
MSFEKVAQNLTQDVYESLKESLQLGKWPDGKLLTLAQKEICMEAIITYELGNGIPESERIGYLNRARATPCAGTNKAQNENNANTSDPWILKH